MMIEPKQKTKNNFLNELQKSEIEDLAEYIANEYSPKGAINLEGIAENNGITFSYGNYKDAFDGLLEHSFGNFHIYINIDRLEHGYTERARFTFAHELGHYFLDNHRNALAQGLAPSHPSFTGFISENLVERQADYFASCLLLPKTRIKIDCFKRKFEFKLIQELSKKYQTSITATALRYSSIGCSPIMVAYCMNNSIKWYWKTTEFPFWVLKFGKSKVPENTAAGEYFSKNRRYTTAEIVYAEDWFDVKFDRDRERQFLEHCVYGTNGSVLSIVWEK
ncbi:ImmA/IrrE family metallo-endopeptidase [Parasediminibacterium sp. JCM 36343]|uniref:ImmA/IrrE family metallo-endopeptidase n=1 Tax=Parasediminibacterium sp. JCM 36343 TaxID=3374279 RepID=UPI00397E5BBF